MNFERYAGKDSVGVLVQDHHERRWRATENLGDKGDKRPFRGRRTASGLVLVRDAQAPGRLDAANGKRRCWAGHGKLKVVCDRSALDGAMRVDRLNWRLNPRYRNSGFDQVVPAI